MARGGPAFVLAESPARGQGPGLVLTHRDALAERPLVTVLTDEDFPGQGPGPRYYLLVNARRCFGLLALLLVAACEGGGSSDSSEGGEGGSEAASAMDALDNECGTEIDTALGLDCDGEPSQECTDAELAFSSCRDDVLGGFDLTDYDALIVQSAVSACRTDSDSVKCEQLTLVADAQDCAQTDREMCSVGNTDACAELELCISES